MDRKQFPIVSLGSIKEPEFGCPDCCPIDQTPSRDFNIDPTTGRPMEEITRVMRCQTQAEMQNSLMNLPVFSSEYLPDDISARDALKFMKPSLCQLPSELAEWSEAIAQYQYDQKVSELQKKKAEEEEAKKAEEAVKASEVSVESEN